MQQQLQKQLAQSVATMQAVEDTRQATSPNHAQKNNQVAKKVQKTTDKQASSNNGTTGASTNDTSSINIQPKCHLNGSTAEHQHYPLAIPPGSIANQMMNRKARQATVAPKKKEKPTKIKKVKLNRPH